jgi:hypothetical protein
VKVWDWALAIAKRRGRGAVQVNPKIIRTYDINGLSEQEYSCIQAALECLAIDPQVENVDYPEYRQTAGILHAQLSSSSMGREREEQSFVDSNQEFPPLTPMSSDGGVPARYADPNDEVFDPVSDDDPRPRARPTPGTVFKRQPS